MGFSLDTTTANDSPTYTHVKKVAIIGAGVAGLQLAERLRKTDVQVTIYEATDHVGGVWSSNYADFGLQVPRELYEFPAFPYPSHMDFSRYPKGPEVQEYIEAFAAHFELNELIRFRTTVVHATPLEDGGWSVSSTPTGGAPGTAAATEAFDFLVVATGMYGGACPNIPAHPGKEAFGGEVLHSFHFTERAQAAGKRVVVVGGGKSAVDCAVAAVKGGAREVTLVFREAHWPVPRKLLDLIPFKFATYSRLGHALLPTHHDVSPLVWWLHGLLTPLKWLIWRLVERIIRWQFALTTNTTPSSRLEIDVFTGGQILTYDARDMIQAGSLKVRRGAISRYARGGVELAGARGGDDDDDQGARGHVGFKLPCDLVVYGTGFVKSYDYLDEATRAKLNIQDDGLYLYRSMLPVAVPGLAFLGSEVSTFNNILTHGLQAAWLASVLSGAVDLPPPRAMKRAVEAEMHWKRTWMPPTSARAAIQQLHMPKYHDRLVADLGQPTLRKSNPLFEALLPYDARDYRQLFGLPDRTAWVRAKTALALAAALGLYCAVAAAAAASGLVAAAACAGVYLLPEEPPRALALGPRTAKSLAAVETLTLVGVASALSGALYAMVLAS